MGENTQSAVNRACRERGITQVILRNELTEAAAQRKASDDRLERGDLRRKGAPLTRVGFVWLNLVSLGRLPTPGAKIMGSTYFHINRANNIESKAVGSLECFAEATQCFLSEETQESARQMGDLAQGDSKRKLIPLLTLIKKIRWPDLGCKGRLLVRIVLKIFPALVLAAVLSISAATKERCNTGFFPPVRDIVHDVPCGFSEAERFREGVQGCGFQISGRRRGPDQGRSRHAWALRRRSRIFRSRSGRDRFRACLPLGCASIRSSS